MKISTTVWIADSCIRHVLKELVSERDYKYTKDERKKTLQGRIDQFEEALDSLQGMKILLKNRGYMSVKAEKE